MKNYILGGAIVLVASGVGFFLINRNKPAVQGSSNNAPIISEAKSFTLEEVSLHRDANSCYSVINGKVYDLTTFLNKHPGGPDRILSICGSDGSAAFNDQHGGQRRPEIELASYFIGNLN